MDEHCELNNVAKYLPNCSRRVTVQCSSAEPTDIIYYDYPTATTTTSIFLSKHIHMWPSPNNMLLLCVVCINAGSLLPCWLYWSSRLHLRQPTIGTESRLTKLVGPNTTTIEEMHTAGRTLNIHSYELYETLTIRKLKTWLIVISLAPHTKPLLHPSLI